MVIFILGTLLVLVMMAWATLQTAQHLRELPATLNLLLLPAENVLRLALIAVCIGLGQVSGLSPAQLGWTSSDPLRDLVIGLGAGGAIALMVPPLTQFAVQAWGKQIYSPIVVLRILPRSSREWCLIPFSLLSAVFLEELLFRSLLLGGFGTLAPPALLALAWSVMFGVLHLPQGSLGMIVAAGLGLVLSALYLSTGSLLTPVIAHYMINLLQLVWASLDKSWLENYEERRIEDAGSHS
jgi:membrane protease YdiL (CAAX protease family)